MHSETRRRECHAADGRGAQGQERGGKNQTLERIRLLWYEDFLRGGNNDFSWGDLCPHYKVKSTWKVLLVFAPII